jgi:hypothetical protein
MRLEAHVHWNLWFIPLAVAWSRSSYFKFIQIGIGPVVLVLNFTKDCFNARGTRI